MRVRMTCFQHSWVVKDVTVLQISTFHPLVSVYCFSALEVTHCLLSSLDWCGKKPTQLELSLSDCCHFHSIDHLCWRFVFVLFFPSLDGTPSSIIHHILSASQRRKIFSLLLENSYLKDARSALACGLWGWGLLISKPGGPERLKEENL